MPGAVTPSLPPGAIPPLPDAAAAPDAAESPGAVPSPEGAVPAAPSAFDTDPAGAGPSVAIAHYDPQSGQYATPDGNVGRQTDLVESPKSWQDLIYEGGAP